MGQKETNAMRRDCRRATAILNSMVGNQALSPESPSSLALAPPSCRVSSSTDLAFTSVRGHQHFRCILYFEKQDQKLHIEKTMDEEDMGMIATTLLHGQ